MYEFFNKIIVRATNSSARHISQFRIPRTDCIDVKTRRVVNAKVCPSRDKGLVLGVYTSDKGIHFTDAAARYDRANSGKLAHLLALSPAPKLGDTRLFYDVDNDFGYIAVAGLGSPCLAYDSVEQMNESKEAVRTAAAVGTRAVQHLSPSSVHVESFGDAEAAAEGASLAIWRFQKYRRITDSMIVPQLYLYDDCDRAGWDVGKLKAEAQNLARYLQEMPANLLNPTSFAKIAVELLCELDINVEVKTQGWAASHNMGGFVAVGESSVQPPLYVEACYYGAGEQPPIVLVGKGVTFDGGSLELKTPEELKNMRGDVAGAAVALATVRAAARLRLPVNLRASLPLCELMPSGRSPRIGDVVSRGGGGYVKVRLSSRTGRLLLADSLSRAASRHPRFVVDIGTMSRELGDCLGAAACGCYGNDPRLLDCMSSASSYTGDRVWKMPLWNFYEQKVTDSETADVANASLYSYADSPNCAAFLKQYVGGSKWMHLDTYNVAYSKGRDFPYLRRGMTGRPTRTLIQLISQAMQDKGF